MIKAEKLRQKIYEYFKRKEVLEYCFNDIKNDVRPSDDNIERRQALAKLILKEGRLHNRPLTETEIEDYKKLKTKKTAKKYLTEFYNDVQEVEQRFYTILETEEYDNYLRHIIFNEPLEDTIERLEDSIETNIAVVLYALYRHVFRYCFYENSGVEDAHFKGAMNSIIYVGGLASFGDKDFIKYIEENNYKNPLKELVNKVGESEEDLNDIIELYNDINGRAEKLADEEDLREQQAEQLKQNTFDIAPRVLYYADNLTIADTEILNILTSQQFTADLKVFSKSEETLNRLKHQDREILDYIVLTLYPNDITVFSDYQIATGLYKEQTRETVSDAMLKEINASIERLRDVKIDEGFISKEKIHDLNAKVEINGNLIVLNRVKVKHKTKATYYQIMTRPFYYDYAIKTGKVNTYPKQIITRDINDVQIEHNIKNDTLKMMLTRRVISLKYYSRTVINVLEIYDTLGITDPRKYTGARDKAKGMLDDLQKDYNFKYSFKKKQRTITQLIIEKYTDRPLKIEKNFS